MSTCLSEGTRDSIGMMASRHDMKPEVGSAELARTASGPHTPLTSTRSMQMEPESPSSSHMAGDSIVHGLGSESMKATSDIPDRVDVVCGTLRGTFLVSKGKIVVDGHTDCPKEVAPTEFERLGGRSATKKWKRSIRVVTEEGAAGKPVGDWLLSYGLDIRANTLMPAVDSLRAAPQYIDVHNQNLSHNPKAVKRARMSPVPEPYAAGPYQSTARAIPPSALAHRVESLVVLGEYLNGRRHDMPLDLLDISEPPRIAGFDLPLGSLFSLVVEHGGYDVVTRNGLWQDVGFALGINHGNSMRNAYLLRSAYQRFLLRYERFQASWNEFLATTSPTVLHQLDMPSYDTEEYCTPDEPADHHVFPNYTPIKMSNAAMRERERDFTLTPNVPMRERDFGLPSNSAMREREFTMTSDAAMREREFTMTSDAGMRERDFALTASVPGGIPGRGIPGRDSHGRDRDLTIPTHPPLSNPPMRERDFALSSSSSLPMPGSMQQARHFPHPSMLDPATPVPNSVRGLPDPHPHWAPHTPGVEGPSMYHGSVSMPYPNTAYSSPVTAYSSPATACSEEGPADSYSHVSPKLPDSFRGNPKLPDSYTRVGTKLPDNYVHVGAQLPDSYAHASPKLPEQYAHVSPKLPEQYAHVSPKLPEQYAHVNPKLPEQYVHVSPKLEPVSHRMSFASTPELLGSNPRHFYQTEQTGSVSKSMTAPLCAPGGGRKRSVDEAFQPSLSARMGYSS